MLQSVDLNDKTYPELLREAISLIPLYSGEWTNFNVSDPGITMLQNLTSFNLLQQIAINTVTDAIRLKLLKLLGFEPAQARAAQTLVKAPPNVELTLPRHKKFMAGDACFETTRIEHTTPWAISAVLREIDGELHDVTALTDSELDASVPVFGCPAREGNAFILVFGGEPDFSRPLTLCVNVAEHAGRNPFDGSEEPRFADIRWQVYTCNGWRDIAFDDGTHCLLVSGEVTLDASQEQPAMFAGGGTEGFAVRCVLEKEQYDFAPRLRTVDANLIRLVQRDTRVAMFRLPGRRVVELTSEMTVYGNIYVYCREKKNAPFREYRQFTGQQGQGRYYVLTRTAECAVSIAFDKARFGFRPRNGKFDIVIVCCTDEAARYRALGEVFGYNDQEIDIDFTENILPEGFCVMAETDEGGVKGYTFARPDSAESDGLGYKLLPAEGKIIVTSPSPGEQCRLFLASCATTLGEQGNLRAGNVLVEALPQRETRLELTNPAAGRGGESGETPEQLRRRFAVQMKKPHAAVLAGDCEQLALQTPGLCIHKVKAYADSDNNLVKIVVKPYNENMLPVLSPVYMEKLAKWLEARRMLTTEIKILQPVYVPIDVKATIYVKSYYENAREQIEQTLHKQLDFALSELEFGRPVRFTDVFQALTALPCVMSVYDLSLTARVRGESSAVGMDIIPGERCLFYPGAFNLEINTRNEL